MSPAVPLIAAPPRPAAPAPQHAPAPAIGDAATLFDAAAKGSTSLPKFDMVGGNRAQLLIDEQQAMPAVLEAIKGATRQIDFVMFALSPTGAGRTVADALLEKAREGVRVNLQVDQVGSMQLPGLPQKRFIDELEQQGINVTRNARLSLGGSRPVDHRKLLVVDGTTMITGGMNFSTRFGKWHDVMVRLDGPVAAQGAAQYLSRWVDEGGDVPPGMKERFTATATGGGGPEGAATGAQLLVNRPGHDLGATRDLLEAIGAAKQRVWVQTPSLTDPAVVDALAAAAQRNVDTRVTVSGKESWIVTKPLGMIGDSFYPQLAQAGVKVYEQPGMSHAKVSLIDDVARVGSLNLSRRATQWDHELVVAMRGDQIVADMHQLFATDFARSHLVTLEEATEPANRRLETVRKKLNLRW